MAGTGHSFPPPYTHSTRRTSVPPPPLHTVPASLSRSPHPLAPHPAVARISPMVPDASLYFGNSTGQYGNPGPEVLQYAAGYGPPRNQFKQNASIGSPLPPPQPTNNILQGIAKPSPEFSRNFDSMSLYDSTGHRDRHEETNNNFSKERVRFVDFVQPLTSLSPPQQNLQQPMKHQTPTENGPEKRNVNQGGGSQSTGESPVPPEILKVLNWQSDQLKLLQEQVQALLQASPQHKHPVQSQSPPDRDHMNHGQQILDKKMQEDSTLPNNPPLRSVGSQSSCETVASIQAAQCRSPTVGKSVSSGTSNSRTVSTNTSILWPQIQEGLKKLTEAINEEEEGREEGDGEKDESETDPSASEIRESRIKVNNSDNESIRSPNSMNIDLPDYPASEAGSPDLKKQQHQGESGVSWESPVLGESVSMYEEEKIQEVYHDILSKVNKLLADPEPSSTTAINNNENRQNAPRDPLAPFPKENSVAVATCNRLRELGVSFISPQDLAASHSQVKPSGSQPPAKANEVSALFLPRALLPSSSVWEGAQSPDTSLEISSLALKYLDEEQLSRLATVHQGATRAHASTAQQSKTEVNMSLASHQFLARYGLNEDGQQSPASSPSLKTGRRPLTTIQNFPGLKQHNLELRREVLKNGTAKENSPQYLGELYRVEEYQNVHLIAGHHSATQTSGQDANVPVRNLGRTAGLQTAKPEVKNRILDITAIKSQPKLL